MMSEKLPISERFDRAWWIKRWQNSVHSRLGDRVRLHKRIRALEADNYRLKQQLYVGLNPNERSELEQRCRDFPNAHLSVESRVILNWITDNARLAQVETKSLIETLDETIAAYSSGCDNRDAEIAALRDDNARVTAELAEVEAASKLFRTEVAKMAGLEYVEITDAGTLAALDRKREELAEARSNEAPWFIQCLHKPWIDALERLLGVEKQSSNQRILDEDVIDGIRSLRLAKENHDSLRARLAEMEKRVVEYEEWECDVLKALGEYPGVRSQVIPAIDELQRLKNPWRDLTPGEQEAFNEEYRKADNANFFGTPPNPGASLERHDLDATETDEGEGCQ